MRLSRSADGDPHYCCNCSNKALHNVETLAYKKIPFCNECFVELLRITSHVVVPLAGGVLQRAGA